MDGGLRTTAIGSLPLTDPAEAARRVFDLGLDVPFWPELPKLGWREGMIPQAVDGFPCVRFDEGKKSVWFDTSPDAKAEELTAFYEKALAEDPAHFAMPEASSAGLYAFLAECERRGERYPVLKGHITGPLTVGLGAKNSEGVAVFYDPEMVDVLCRGLALRALWQVRELEKHADEVIVFYDEPVLAGFGTSAYLSLTAEAVIETLGEAIAPLKAEAAVGIHCCGNTDWAMMTRTGADVVSFDSHGYQRSLALYPDAVREFLEAGGNIAWGAVPTLEHVGEETADQLTARLREGFALLVAKGIPEDLIRRKALLTPGCGAGSLTEEELRWVFDSLEAVRDSVR